MTSSTTRPARAVASRSCFTGTTLKPFYGHEPTGKRGVMVETHTITIRAGRIVEQWVGDNSFQMPYMDLVTFGMEFPRDTPHPKPPIVEASVAR
jgi:hypothetical protein